MRSQKFMGFCSITFFLFDKDCIVLKISILHNDHCGSQDNICYRQRNQYLPSETHQLIIAETWQCPAYPHEEKDKAENLQEENQHPDDRNPILGQTQLIHKREIISAEVQGSNQCRLNKHINILGKHIHTEFHRRIFRMVSPDKLCFILRQVKRNTITLRKCTPQKNQETDRLCPNVPV